MEKKNISLLIGILFLVLTMFFSAVDAALEDFTTWVEVDGGGDLTVNANNINYVTMTRNVDDYVWDDKGANSFGDFVIELDWRYTDSTGGAPGPLWLSNHLDDWNNLDNGVGLGAAVAQNKMRIHKRIADVITQLDESVVVNVNTWYYMVFNRTGTECYLEIYSSDANRNAGGAGDVDTLYSAACTDTKYQYIMASVSFNEPDPGSSSGDVANVEIVDYGVPGLNITIGPPYNTTYHNNTMMFMNYTVVGTDFGEFQCWTFLNDSLIYYGNTTNSTNNESYFNVTGGYYDLGITCENGQGNFSGNVSFFVMQGVNITVWDNETNASINGWDVHMSNGSVSYDYSNISVNNPGIFEVNITPTGDVEINVSKANYHNFTINLTINNTYLHNLTANLTAKAENTLTLTAIPSWSIVSGTSINVSCSALSGMPSLYRNGILVSNPFVSTLPSGTYLFNCTISETANYSYTQKQNYLVISAIGEGCTSNTTFAFIFNRTNNNNSFVFNFTDLYDRHLVKFNLTDVYVRNDTGGVAVSINTTDGHYLIVNTTDAAGLSKISIEFGNYLANYTYNSTHRNGTEVNITAYDEYNSYYVLTVFEEKTSSKTLPLSDNMTMNIYCDSGQYSFEFNDTYMVIPTYTSMLDEMEFIIHYSLSEVYIRSYLPTSSVEYKNIWLTDATIYQVVQMSIELEDYTGEFSDSVLKLKKQIGGSEETITERRFDAEDKVIIFPLNNDRYNLYVDNGVEERSIGYLYIDSTDLEKTITIGNLQTVNPATGNISYSFSNTSNSITFSYNDSGGNTLWINFKVINVSNNYELYNSSIVNHTQASFTYIVPAGSDEWQMKAIAYVHHSIFGANTFTFSYIFTFIPLIPAFPLAAMPLIGTIPIAWSTFVVSVGVIAGSLAFGAISAASGIIIIAFIAILFASWGWWEANVMILGIAIIFAILNKLTHKKVES